MNKKSSMQLGINAIVVLIIALAVLGIALSFITGLFRLSEDKYKGIIENVDLEFHADSLTPIMFESDDVSVKAGKEQKLDISVYNSWFADDAEVGLEITNCIASSGDSAWIPGEKPFITIIASPQTIPLGTDSGFRTLVSAAGASSSNDRGIYICTVQAGEWNSVNEEVFNDEDHPTPISHQLLITIVP